ncbi:hypothetical protein e1012e08.tmp0055 [Eimeria tenella]|uniref:Uncharacterized protein n=1 Tax=Eimeria tenella TaxID=5802 RepID=C8TDK1_EIMTE|nr:hypothetical protein e1012e08.tmp0055 [Eimeria tenella]
MFEHVITSKKEPSSDHKKLSAVLCSRKTEHIYSERLNRHQGTAAVITTFGQLILGEYLAVVSMNKYIARTFIGDKVVAKKIIKTMSIIDGSLSYARSAPKWCNHRGNKLQRRGINFCRGKEILRKYSPVAPMKQLETGPQFITPLPDL